MLLITILGCGSLTQEVDSAAPCATREFPLSYDNFGEPFLERHCTACHSS